MPAYRTEDFIKRPAEVADYDLAIVGGGPAGALAAILAAEAGFSVVVLERKSKCRPKLCGGFISKRAIDLLPASLKIPEGIINNVHNIEVIRGGRRYSYNSGHPLGWLIRREIFDSLMLREAESNGVAVITGVYPTEIFRTGSKDNNARYNLSTGGKKCIHLSARYLIGADGAYGTTARLAGLYKNSFFLYGRSLSAVNTGMPAEEKAGTLVFYPSPLIGGMSWAFYADGYTNLGIGGLAGHERLKNILKRTNPVKNGKPCPRFWPLPFLGPMRANSCGNLMLIGDAAGLVEPFSGEGLFNSFASAHIAIQAIVDAKGGNREAEKVFRTLFRKQFRRGFAATLLGAALLEARAILKPSSLPAQMALLMENRLWFCRELKRSYLQ